MLNKLFIVYVVVYTFYICCTDTYY